MTFFKAWRAFFPCSRIACPDVLMASTWDCAVVAVTQSVKQSALRIRQGTYYLESSSMLAEKLHYHSCKVL